MNCIHEYVGYVSASRPPVFAKKEMKYKSLLLLFPCILIDESTKTNYFVMTDVLLDNCELLFFGLDQ